MRRIVVLGCPGSGKTTLARRLATDLCLTHIAFDNLNWRPGWTEASPEEFSSLLDTALAQSSDGWVTDGNYGSRSQGRHIAQADTVVWLDLPKRTIMWRVTARTIRRAATREKLFGHNITEPLTNFYRWAPEKNIIRWAWVYYHRYKERYEAAIATGEWDHLTVHHLRSPMEIEAFALEASSAQQDRNHP